MPTQVVSAVGAEFEEFAAELVKRGRYASKREVLADAKAALACEATDDDDLNLTYVLKAIDDGDASGIYEGDVFADLRVKHGLPPEA